MKTWVTLDCNYLAYRAWFTTGSLSFGDISTGVLYGFLREVVSLQDRFQPRCFIFCFDYGSPIRKEIYPAYKSNRHQNLSEEDVESYKLLRKQIKELRREHLPNLGYSNILYQKGYEADDCIAKVIHDNVRRNINHIIVSADHDLYQLLGPTVSLYNPHRKTITTDRSFSEEYGVSPSQWVDVKAIAGCSSDTIQGIKGVGEKTAAKFIAGKLKGDSVAFKKIVEGNGIWRANLPLVKLPYEGLQDFQLCENEKVGAVDWEIMVERLGMKTLAKKLPLRNKGFGIR
jgi:5'-3' exonuclease